MAATLLLHGLGKFDPFCKNQRISRAFMKYIIVFSVLASAFCFSGCATITKDDSQPVAFSSDPQGAIVKINNIPRGVTPTTIMVKRAMKKQMISFEMEGYHSETFKLEKSVAGMTFGNIIFGGLIGVGVDIATGKATNYEESVHVKLIPLTRPRLNPVDKGEEISDIMTERQIEQQMRAAEKDRWTDQTINRAGDE